MPLVSSKDGGSKRWRVSLQHPRGCGEAWSCMPRSRAPGVYDNLGTSLLLSVKTQAWDHETGQGGLVTWSFN
jgi:hypothetical protein